ncbi:radial spoke protein 7 [Plasmopara halstedii]|uniref:Radial spoke protein 7 n=1 Tax=Plasmopara halstedii TaxID=4781 RepID=A0A0P1APD2_PLAHL|nr:radial spoke protein 7 [Plasmopara halstedii]CEG43109.1 radial spoke protein 7 [Plasmopara halstedii]|eukprot:XP_024579478.1 radial spoke protein 7 [Plasmopara halstedii]
MASKYAKPMEIPAEFPVILRDFTREVLRQQGKVETKEAIYAFGSQYFKDLIANQNEKREFDDSVLSALTPALIKSDEETIKGLIIAAFDEVQQQHGGFVAYEEFKQVLDQVGEQLQMSSIELKTLYAEADESEGGVINCADFIPLAIQALLQLRLNYTRRSARTLSITKRDSGSFFHGMLQDEMESILREIFQRADEKEIGALTRSAFMDAIRDADLGFTRKEVNILMSEAPAAEEDTNMIVYPDFVPICFSVLEETYNHGILDELSDPDWIAQYLTEVFASEDGEGTGRLSTAEIARLFRTADVGLTRLQIIAVMAEAQEDDTGLIEYQTFASRISGMVLALTNVESYHSCSAFLQRYRTTSEYYTVLNMNQHTFEQALSSAFQADDGGDHGMLIRDHVPKAIRSAFPAITDRQLRSILALSEPDQSGKINSNLITRSAFQALQKLQEYDMMVTVS